MADQQSALDAIAASCAQRLPATARSFRDDRAALSPELDRLIDELRVSDPRFAFDRDGRPGAVGAIREALPAMEADLLDAVLEDVACELAAMEEALYRLALAARGS